jgi:syntaxin-binding protein 1
MNCYSLFVVVEKITIARQPLPKMDAIYLLTPKPDVIDQLINDFKNPKEPQYGVVHLYFTSRNFKMAI